MHNQENRGEPGNDVATGCVDVAPGSRTEIPTHSEGPTESSRDLTQRLGDPAEFRVVRDDERDLAFSGWKIGSGCDGTGGRDPSDWTRRADVTVYATVTGRVVTAVERTTRWEGEYPRHRASVHTSGGEAYAWLMDILQAVREEQREHERERPLPLVVWKSLAACLEIVSSARSAT